MTDSSEINFLNGNVFWRETGVSRTCGQAELLGKFFYRYSLEIHIFQCLLEDLHHAAVFVGEVRQRFV